MKSDYGFRETTFLVQWPLCGVRINGERSDERPKRNTEALGSSQTQNSKGLHLSRRGSLSDISQARKLTLATGRVCSASDNNACHFL